MAYLGLPAGDFSDLVARYGVAGEGLALTRVLYLRHATAPAPIKTSRTSLVRLARSLLST